MSSPIKNKRRTAAGLLAVLGFFGRTTPCVATPQAPTADAPAAASPASEAPSAPPAVPLPKVANDGPPTVLLRTNGKVLQGEVLRDANGYVLKHRIGVFHFARRDVEATFRSMDELYAYKVRLCPPDDLDERMKLASWCLEQKLKIEAKEQLEAILEISPDQPRAKAMLANLDRPLSPMQDGGVVRTELVIPMPASAPADVSLGKLRDEYARNPRAAGMPAIFDLDTPLAVRRYQEFVGTVHPILQRRCAKCHNEATPGEFQIIQTRTKKDMANDLVARSNLESTLLIISREDLARSPILQAAGMTHGNGGKPVLGGPANSEYRALAAWVTTLKPAGAKAPNLSSPPSGTTPPAEEFAAGRFGPNSDPSMPPIAKANRSPQLPARGSMLKLPSSIPGVVGAGQEPDPAADLIDGTQARRPGQLLPGSEVGMPSNPPADDQFQSRPIRRPDFDPSREPAEPAKIDPAEPRMIRLPDGTMAPLMSKAAVAKKKTGQSPKQKIDAKALEGFLKARPTAIPGTP